MDTLFLALRVLLSLAAVLGVIWFAQRRLSKGVRAKAGKTINVVGRQGIGAKASVAVIDVDGKRFLLGVTEHAVTILHTSDAPIAAAEAFSRALEAETGAPAAAAAAKAPLATAKGPLAGSILSADTWRRAFASLRP
jgi:flagellar protein FliO/FliZ